MEIHQAQRLERALKEWNSSETERRRSECQARVLEQVRAVAGLEDGQSSTQ